MTRLPARRFAVRHVAIAAATAIAAASLPAHALPVNWVTSGSSFWDIAANWSGGLLPTAADDVFLTLAGTRTVTYRQATTVINSLTIGAGNTLAVTGGTLTAGVLTSTGAVTVGGGTLNLANGSSSGTMTVNGGTLGLTGTLNATGLITLGAGTISGGTIQASGASRLTITSAGGTLDGVTYRGDLNIGDATNSSGRVRIGSNGLTVLSESGASPGVINVGTAAGTSGTVLGFTGTQTLNNAVVNLGNSTQNAFISLDGGGTFTLGAGATIQGRGNVGAAQFAGGTNNFVNAGTVSANIGGATLTFNQSGTLTNNGILEARNGGVLTLGSNWSNAGTVRVADATSTVNLGGTFTNASLGTFANAAGGNLNLTGTLNNAGATLAFSAATGSMRLAGGTVSGGTVQASGTNRLVTTGIGGTLDGVTYRGNLNVGEAVTGAAALRIGTGGIVVLSESGAAPGVLNVGAAAGSGGSVLGFTGTQTLDNVVLSLGNSTTASTISLDAGGTFTLGANATIQGRGNIGQAQFAGGTNNIVNAGTVSAHISGATLLFNQSGTLTNNGVLEARNGGVLTLGGTWVNAGLLRVADATSVVNLGGTFTSSTLGSFANAGGSLNLTGTLNNAGSTLAFSAGSGPLRLLGGTLNGGTVQASGANRLVFTSSSGTLNGVTYRGDLTLGDATNPAASLRIGSNGIVVLTESGASPGLINVGTAAGTSGNVLGFTGTQTLDNAIVSLGNATQNASISLDAGGTFTLGAGATVQGRGNIGTAQFVGGTNNFVNAGTVSAHIGGGTLTFNQSGTLTNNGVMEARNGGVLTLGGAWTNAGLLRVADATSTVNLGGTFTNASLGSFANAGGNLNLTGTLNNAGSTLTFSAATGPLRLVGGILNGGTVQASGANRLVMTAGSGTLNGVTYRGDLTLGDAANPAASLRIGSNGIVVLTESGASPGLINVGTATGTSGNVLGFTGTQTLDNAIVSLGNATQSASISLDAGGTFTLGAGATIQGRGGVGTAQFVGGTNNFVNAGTVSAHINGGTLSFSQSGTLTNNGVMEARNGGTLTLGGAWSNAGLLRVADATSTVNLGGTFTNATLGSFANLAGGNLNLTGTLNNAGSTLTFSAATGPLRLVGGTLNGGTVQASGANRLVISNSGGILDGVAYRGDLTVGDTANTSGRVRIGSAGITVLSETGAAPGAINVGTIAGASGAIIGFTGTQTLNNAVLSLGNSTQNASVSLDAGGTLTLGATTVVQGRGNIGTAQFVGGTNNVVNAGTVSANISGGTLTFNQSGTLTNNGILEARNGGTLTLGGTWTNGGTLRVADAASVVNLGGTFTNASLGSFDNAAGGSLNLNGTLVNTSSTLAFSPSTGSMRLLGGTVNGGTVQTSGANRLVFTGSGGILDGVVHRGDLTVGDATNIAGRVRIGSNGITVLSETGAAPGVINVGTVAGATNAIIGFTGTQTLDNAVLSLGNATQNAQISLDGTGTFTLGANGTLQGRGNIGAAQFVGGTASFVNAGLFSANLAGGTITVNNSGSFTNTGTLDVRNGATMTLGATGGFTNFSGTTLTGGTYVVTGASTLQFSGANVVTNAADIQLDGSASVFRNSSGGLSALANLAANAATGRLTIRNGRNLTTIGAFSNAGVVTVGSGSTFTTTGSFADLAGATLQMAGGTFAATSLGNAGTVAGFGTVSPLVQNSGLVRATGGTLTASQGIQGSGNIVIDSGATLNLAGATAASTVSTLTSVGSLALGAQNLNVAIDYANGLAGSGNAFNARNGVSGSGQIIGVNASQTLTGDVVANGANAYVMDFGNVRGGASITRSFSVVNNGTGAVIRGALQTGGPGLGNITDSRLSGSGVTAGNFGPLVAGSQATYSVTLNPAQGGSLAGQNVVIVSNFGNVATQTLALTGFSTVLAQGQATPGGPLNLGNFRVGVLPEATSSLSITNTTTGPGAERLGLAAATTSGNFSAVNLLGSGFLAPGATLAGAVALSTAGGVVGLNSGSVTLDYTTNGTLVDASFATQAANRQTVALSATGYLVAQPVLPVTVVDVGNYRLNTGASGNFAVFNTPVAPAGLQEVLNVTAGTATAGVTVSGSITGLNPGASGQMSIALASGGAAGARSGSSTLNLVSDGTGTSGLGTLALASQTIGISGTAYRLAVPVVDTTPLNLVARVGGTAPGATIGVTNNAPDIYTERLNATITAAPTGYAASGSITGLGPNASSNALAVTLATGTAGTYAGNVTVGLVSSGAGTTGAADAALASANVAVNGKVYAPAVAQVNTSTVDFGIVRVGDVVGARFVSVSNGASGALTDTLQASLGGAAAPFAVSGSVTGLAAGATSSNALRVQLSTVSAGVYSGSTTVSFVSHNPDMPDLTLGGSTVTLTGQVNNVALPALARTGGAGTFSGSALSYTLDFGAVTQGGSTSSAVLSLSNAAGGPADALVGTWNLAALAGGPFSASGFGAFNLAAGQSTGALGVDFSSSSLGVFSTTVVLRGNSVNGFGPDLALPDLTLTLTGSVVAVPEPGSWALMALGLAALGSRVRRRRLAMAA